MESGESRHLDAFVRYIAADDALRRALRDRQWAAFARAYNGPDYAANLYDVKLARAMTAMRRNRPRRRRADPHRPAPRPPHERGRREIRRLRRRACRVRRRGAGRACAARRPGATRQQLVEARQALAGRDDVIARMRQDTAERARQQARLDRSQAAIASKLDATRLENRRLTDENAALRAWAGTRLPDDVVRLQANPAHRRRRLRRIRARRWSPCTLPMLAPRTNGEPMPRSRSRRRYGRPARRKST